MNKKSGSEQSVCLEAMLSWFQIYAYFFIFNGEQSVQDLLKPDVKIKLKDKNYFTLKVIGLVGQNDANR